MRSHEYILQGHSTTHNERVQTIFSAANHGGFADNKGAVMVIEGTELKARVEKFDAST